MDGTGYPDGLKGESIPLNARIMHVVDVYDALTTDRPYRKGLSRACAASIMSEETAQGWLDPSLVDQFLSISDDLPGFIGVKH
jgi:putative two-component system response regulator